MEHLKRLNLTLFFSLLRYNWHKQLSIFDARHKGLIYIHCEMITTIVLVNSHHLKLILWGHQHHDTKTRQGYHIKRKLQASITNKNRFKNPQQNTYNWLQQYTEYHTPCSSRIYPRNARIFHYSQVNVITPH